MSERRGWGGRRGGRKKRRKETHLTQQGLNQSKAKIRHLVLWHSLTGKSADGIWSHSPYSCVIFFFLLLLLGSNPSRINLLFIKECIARSIVAVNLIVPIIPNCSMLRLLDTFTLQLNNVLPPFMLNYIIMLKWQIPFPVYSSFFFLLFLRVIGSFQMNEPHFFLCPIKKEKGEFFVFFSKER